MIKVVVPISGGKDSQACLKLALSKFKPDEVVGLFCDTKFEHPWTYAQVELLQRLYGEIRIDTISAGTVYEKIEKYRRIPDFGTRFCTDELKIIPTKKYLKELAQSCGHGFEVWYGMRTQESSARNKRYAGKVCDELYAPHEIMPRKYPKYLAKLNVLFRLPILHWADDDVLCYVGMRYLNPLYLFGFDRVGCFPCLASGDKPKAQAFKFDSVGFTHFKNVRVIAEKIGKPIFTGKNSDSIGCAICAM